MEEELNALPPRKKEHKLYYTYFEEQCPNFMAMGMSYDEYWNGGGEIAKYYYKAFKQRIKNENTMLHLQGMYIYEALCEVSPLYDPFSRHRKPAEYAKHPYDIFDEDVKKRQEQEYLARYNAFKDKVVTWAGKSGDK